MNSELEIPLHLLNQAAESHLRALKVGHRAPGKMAVIKLAHAAIAVAPPHPANGERGAWLDRWDISPKWQSLALNVLEKNLTPQKLRMKTPIEAGIEIAVLLNAKSP